jgi:hypothetical protein
MIDLLITPKFTKLMDKYNKTHPKKSNIIPQHTTYKFIQSVEDSKITCIKIFYKEKITILAKSIEDKS